jgi:lactate dehydrogenase-like 2-hydroxyacid dehydrogenase
MLTDRIDGAVMDAAGSGLRVISNFAVGVDNIDLAAATRRGIPVGHTPGILTDATADLTWALLLGAARRIVEGDRYVRAGLWQTWEPQLLLGAELSGATLGLVGMGRIGQAVARRAQGFAMQVLYSSRGPAVQEHGATRVDFRELLAESDFVSIHAPLTTETLHLFDAAAFAQMKPGAILVNTARGPLVDSDALYDALASGRLAAAALDVTEPEPLPANHRLLNHERCLVVPHLGSATSATRDRMATMAAENLLAGIRSLRLPHCANPDVYARTGAE